MAPIVFEPHGWIESRSYPNRRAMKQDGYLHLFNTFDPPYDGFEDGLLGAEHARELATVSKLWLTCGYAPGVGAYLNFFLLRDFIETHDTAFPRFAEDGRCHHHNCGPVSNRT